MKFAAIFACGCAALMSASAFAGADDALITFSTKGPDKYADGTVVKDGENYALVWIRAGKAFGGFTAEGKLVDAENNMLLGVFPRAKDGRCEDTFVQIDKTFVEAYGGINGSFSLYLLDTRTADKAAVAETAGDLANGVQSYGQVAALEVASGAIKVTTAAEAGEAATSSALPSGILPPVIKSAEVKDGMFVVTVEQTVPYIRYNLSGGETPEAADKAGIAEAPKAGDAKQTIELKYPIKDGESVKFFKVTRDPISK